MCIGHSLFYYLDIDIVIVPLQDRVIVKLINVECFVIVLGFYAHAPIA